MSKIAVVADEDTCRCFMLAGVKQSHATTSPREAEAAISELARSPDISLIIVTERLYEGFSKDFRNRLHAMKQPLVVVIPGKEGPLPKKEDPIAQLIRRAIGIEVRIV